MRSTAHIQTVCARRAGWLAILAAFSCATQAVAADVLTDQRFEAATLPAGGWGFWTGDGGTVAIATDTTKTHAGSAGSVRGTYPARGSGGGGYVWCGFDVSAHATRELYIDFWAKMPSTTKQGLKFLKIFGKRGVTDNDNYANTTFGLDYTGVDVGGMYCVSFGDGAGVSNDTASVINFDGSSGSWIGRSYGTAVVSTPQRHIWASSNWGTTWHHFRMRVKFNSGTTADNEVADGAYYVEIDGQVYVDARNLFNRHWSNGPIDRVELFGWTQTGTSPFEIWYDDVTISTGGFDDGDVTPPARPAAPTVSDPSSAHPTLSGTTEAAATVRIFDDGALVASVTADGSGTWSWTPTTALGGGVHAFTVTASDAAGNTSPASLASTVTVATGGSGGGSDHVGSPTGDSGGCGAGGVGGLGCVLALLAGLRRSRR
jgi:hypothetical protein